MSRRLVAVAAVLLCLPLAGAAAIAQQPGLWTVSIKLGQEMPELDPELVAQIEALGMSLPKREDQIRSYDLCLTPEQVKKDRLPDIRDEDSGCTARNLLRVGDKASGDLFCDGRLSGRGTAQVTLISAKTFTGSASFEGATQEGIPLFLNGALDGKWVSDNCGAVKPYAL